MRLQLATAGSAPARDAAGCLVLVGLALLKQPRSENTSLGTLGTFCALWRKRNCLVVEHVCKRQIDFSPLTGSQKFRKSHTKLSLWICFLKKNISAEGLVGVNFWR